MATTMMLMTSCSRHLGSRDFELELVSAVRKVPQCVQFIHSGADMKFGSISLVDMFQRSSSTSCSKLYPGALLKPVSAAHTGLEALITDPDANSIHVKNARIVVESQEDTLMQVRVDLMGEDTRVVFDKVLTNLGRTAPPVPGFRRQKGGKTSKVPKDFLLQILGKERVTKFVIQEIVTSTLADYVKKENLTVKDNKISTIQSAEELRSVFVPGNEFGFNATLELETSSSNASES